METFVTPEVSQYLMASEETNFFKNNFYFLKNLV